MSVTKSKTSSPKSSTSATDEFIGYAKYTGPLVEGGVMDARKSAKALIGFDEAIRELVAFQDKRLKDEDYELPVQIREGSWAIFLPLVGIATAFGMAYAKTAGTKLAEKDFADVGSKDVLKNALRAMQWILRIGKHVGQISLRSFTKLRYRKGNTEVGIPNKDGKYLFVPKIYLDMYGAVRPDFLAKLAELVERDRTLSIGVNEESSVVEERLPYSEKSIFVDAKDDDDKTLFPELTHGMKVVLKGDLTRGNKATNTLGFRYQDHILTCDPQDGSIVRFKKALFGPVRIHAIVSRKDEFGAIAARRPRLLVSRIHPLKVGRYETRDLFVDDGADE
jgi:hypothetical protein